MTQQNLTDVVRRRRVFYIPGFDPMHPRRYRELYRVESAAQAEISSYEVALRGEPGRDGFGWQVAAVIDGVETATDVDVLTWSDIVRSSMSQSIIATYLHLARTLWRYVSSGALWRLMQLRKGPVIAALYPAVMLSVQLVLAVLSGSVLGGAAMSLAGVLGLSGHATVFASALLGVAFAVGVLRLFKRHDAKFFAYYLMHDYADAAAHYGAYSPALTVRIAQFSDKVREACAAGYDEVLVVGHSSGAHPAISALADVLRGPGPAPKNLALLTLGQVVPMLSFLPCAARLRGDLALMGHQNTVAWVDVSAPGDGCAFALCDPVAVSGMARSEVAQTGPLVLSAAFRQTLSPARWHHLRWRFFRLHFQYLCAFDRPGAYDYFQITAGPWSLAQRFAGRAPSKSRITRALNPFREGAA